MSVASFEDRGRRVSVPLDPGMLVEALILQRLITLPKRRHPDWIRSLLVQGFLAESRVVRQITATASPHGADERRVKQTPRSGFDFSDWVSRSATRRSKAKVTPGVTNEVPESPAKPACTEKPFAHLRKVVG